MGKPTKTELKQLVKHLTAIYYVFTSNNKYPEQRLTMAMLRDGFIGGIKGDESERKWVETREIIRPHASEVIAFVDKYPDTKRFLISFIRSCQEYIASKPVPGDDDE